MQSKRDGLVPIADIFTDWDGPVKPDAKPQTVRPFTQADQVNALVSAREADADRGFMARLMTLCSLPRANPGTRLSVHPREWPVLVGHGRGCQE